MKSGWVKAALGLACLLLVSTSAAQALPAMVKVSLFSSRPLERVFFKAPLVVHGANSTTLASGRYVVSVGDSGVVLSRVGGRKTVVARGRSLELQSVSSAPLSLSDSELAVPHLYKGRVTVSAQGRGRLLVVNEVDCKSYISSCVGSESPTGFAPEALKAQAVLCATLLDGNLGGRKILEDSTVDQSYLGATAERPEVRQAVDAVFGQELFYGARPVRVYYCSTCGGRTCTPQIFGGIYDASKYPYLRAVDCNYCARSPFARDLVTIATRAQLESKAGLSAITVKHGLDGRPLKVSVDKDHHNEMWSGYQLFLAMGKAFGWGFLPSTRFSVLEKAGTYSFVSRGCGHGVGLCQWGADGQARAGRDYRRILQFYFPGTRIKVLGGANG